ncbi:atherin-like [Hyaena hyaena]|uniref:atherin-like n=1 Tax=Hyaena hyaena TaxID=95912 RepID=UPI001924A4A5|nr:atherin-like [Hyaena hyaena]
MAARIGEAPGPSENTLDKAASRLARRLGSQSERLGRASREPLGDTARPQRPALVKGSPLGPAPSADVRGERRRERGWAETSAACDSACSATPPRAPAPPAPPGASFPGSRRAAPRPASAGRPGARAPLRLFPWPPWRAPPCPSTSGHAVFPQASRVPGAGRLRRRRVDRVSEVQGPREPGLPLFLAAHRPPSPEGQKHLPDRAAVRCHYPFRKSTSSGCQTSKRPLGHP